MKNTKNPSVLIEAGEVIEGDKRFDIELLENNRGRFFKVTETFTGRNKVVNKSVILMSLTAAAAISDGLQELAREGTFEAVAESVEHEAIGASTEAIPGIV